MKNLAMLVVAGMMGLMLAACGEQKQPENKVEVKTEQPAQTTTTTTETASDADKAAASENQE